MASAISRNIRSLVTPTNCRRNGSRSSRWPSHGSCTSPGGARVTRTRAHQRRQDLRRTALGSDEAVAAARHGLDELRHRRIVTEGAANLQDDYFEHPVADVRLRPAGAQQLLFRDQLPAVFNQAAQYLEGLRG